MEELKQNYDRDFVCAVCDIDLRGETGRPFYMLEKVKVCPECIRKVLAELKIEFCSERGGSYCIGKVG